ncbi:hypothetical protein M407DRAFT_126958 [Tulasnella calospora MUT 4182]|uniref:BAH domain-containing protein n=1 Tax=Tulasnella calospora MUT 4182 TaxID=1051891 RepID=A0A0C3QWN4_9AGAM|nr:hypothetical protein M407DRAFT_126958 [Tulasnella calospora MUT 4182]
MSRKRNHGRVSFNPIVSEKHLENGLSEEEEEEAEEVEEEEVEVAKELEMESGSADEAEQDETPTLTPQEARALASRFKQMVKAKGTGFKKGDIILVRPDRVPKKKLNPELLWKARVIEPRKDQAGKVYLGIHWFYSAEQTSALNLPRKVKFNPHLVCGKHELIETTHEDIISREDFVSPLAVHQLTDDPEQEEIEDGTWYTRAYYNVKSNAFTKMTTAPCTICKGYYRPESGKEKDEQAYCPKCHKWYHHICLDEKGLHQSQDECEEDLTRRLARNIPEPTSQPPAKRSRNNTVPKSTTSPTRRAPQGAELRAQKDLRRIAGTRIVRGATFGITGTVKQIYTARRMLSELESGVISRLSSTGWKEEIGVQLVEDSKDWPESTEFCYICPNCPGRQAI